METAAIFRKNLLEIQSDLQRFAFKLTGDKEEANDLLQDTSLKALENMDKYTPNTNFKGWVYTIMRNIFINNYRKVVSEQTYVDRSENLHSIDSAQLAKDYVTENNYDNKELRRVVNSLPDTFRLPFSMFVSGFKYKEIADKLSLPLGTVKSRIFFTRRHLQEVLRDFR